MTTKEQWREREEQWKRFHQWEAAQPVAEMSPEEILDHLDTILGWLPPEALTEDPDPEKLGIQKWRAMLAQVESRR